jgi:UDP-N-acetylglucosamine 4-epimerase
MIKKILSSIYLKGAVLENARKLKSIEPEFKPFRQGDIKHSLSSIELAKMVLGYCPRVKINNGLYYSCEYFISKKDEYARQHRKS